MSGSEYLEHESKVKKAVKKAYRKIKNLDDEDI
jgi:hypothetical protein